tara:strand:+ start:2107 stop:2907 length:801 start_codon:yes stop_codon:yes gene_type:complete
MLAFFLFIYGCCIGSFINVLIYRLPIKQSIIYPRSYCIECGTSISWYDNIPILSWLLLLGKCRSCKNKISSTYPLIELITGMVFLTNLYSNPSFYIALPFIPKVILGSIFASICIILSLLDYRYFWLPRIITFSGIFIGVFFSLIIELRYSSIQFNYFFYSISSALLGFIIFYLLAFFGKLFFKKQVLGEGDAKLAALLGSWLGIKGLFITLWLAFNSAGIFVLLGLALKKISKKQKIPLGVFLSLSGLVVWIFGNENLLQLINSQ